MNHPRPMIAYSQGIYLYDDSGKRYIDGSGGPLVINVGHGREEIVAAMAQQAQRAEEFHDGVEQAELRVKEIAPGQAHRDGRDHHRQDEQGAEEGHAAP